MRKNFILVLIIMLAIAAFSAITATTEDGRKVVLNNNGTWEWLNNPQPGPSPSGGLAYDITGSWTISFTVGIFDEQFDVEIMKQGGGYTLLWHGTFEDKKYPITVVNERELQFQGKSFHNGVLNFKATIESASSMYGTATSSGAFSKTGSFKAVRQ